MIKCNLAVLMAERQLKMSDVIKDTGIAKLTVRSLYYNQGKGVQFETMDNLCDYLNVSPGQLFSKIEFHAEVVSVDETLAPNYMFTFEFDVGDGPFEEDVKVQIKSSDNEKLKVDVIMYKLTYDSLVMVPKHILQYELTRLLIPTTEKFPESKNGVDARLIID